jgi:hypothetical protein
MSVAREPQQYIPPEAVWNAHGYDSIDDTGREAEGSDKYTQTQLGRRRFEVGSRSIEGGDRDKLNALAKRARRISRGLQANNPSGPGISLEAVQDSTPKPSRNSR